MQREILGFFLATGDFAFGARVPDGLLRAARFPIDQGDGALLLEVIGDKNGVERVLIDTGNPGGIELPPDQWRLWKAANPSAPVTFEVSSEFGDELACRERSMAATFSVGDLDLVDVPIGEASDGFQSLVPSKKVIALGLAALSRMVLVVDGPNHMAFAAPSGSPPADFSHNRLGVVFLPAKKSGELIAHVAAKSPAASAGLRDGDVLLKVNGVTVDGWDQYRKLQVLEGSLDWSIAPNTRVEFTVSRDGHTIQISALSRNILTPSSGGRT